MAGTPEGSRVQQPARWRQLALALFLALATLLGAVELHPAGELHDPLAAARDQASVYFPGASHPLQGPHAEQGAAAERPFCPACLNRLQNGGAHLRPLAAAVLPAPAAGGAPAPLAPAPAEAPHHPRSARAPPLR
ncbi:MAG TPA: hypothetical protein VHR45_13775 [Thermoanaerobaculia bacterium]|nr:hypothetical protein [Thermoanaerobaculia bacterium]